MQLLNNITNKLYVVSCHGIVVNPIQVFRLFLCKGRSSLVLRIENLLLYTLGRFCPDLFKDDRRVESGHWKSNRWPSLQRFYYQAYPSVLNVVLLLDTLRPL